MDLYDKKILRLLIDNCRYSLTDIAKTVNLSKDSVKNRIKRLEERQIITDYSLMVDPRVLGYQIYHLLLKLEAINDDKNQFINQLKLNKNITFISTQCGTYDMQVIFHGKNHFEKTKVQNEILHLLSNKIKSYGEVTHIEDYNFSFLFSDVNIDVKLKEKNDTSFSKALSKNKYETGGISNLSTFDSIDKKILGLLIKNPREKLINISNKINMSPEGLKKRINSIIEKKGILKFTLFPNHEKLDLFNYMLLFKCKPFDTKTEKELSQFFKSNDWIIYSAKYFGSYNFFVYILARNPKEFASRFEKLKEIIDKYIIDYDLSILTKVHKYIMYSNDFLEN